MPRKARTDLPKWENYALTIAKVGVAAHSVSYVRLSFKLEVPAGFLAVFVALAVFTFPRPWKMNVVD